MYISEDNSIICDSLESFLCLILNENNDAVRQETHLYFRGENKYHKYLVPNLYLDEGLTKRSSDYYYRMLLSQIGSVDYGRFSASWSKDQTDRYFSQSFDCALFRC